MTTPPKSPKPPAKKPAAKRPAADKPKGQASAATARVDLTVVKSEGEGTAASGLRLKDLVDRVAETSGVKKQDVKKVIEAALMQMGAALQAGEGLNLPGLGKMRVARPAENGGAMTLKSA